jgi:hypothetical protein
MRPLRGPRLRHLEVSRAPIAACLSALVVASAAAGGGPPQPTALAAFDEDGALLLVAGTFDRTCEEATSILFQCGRWELFVHLDPPAQTPGPKPLASPDTWAQKFTSDGRTDATECSLWGGTFEQGTVEITASDDDTVSFTIAGTAAGDFDADGSYDAVRCKDP